MWVRVTENALKSPALSGPRGGAGQGTPPMAANTRLGKGLYSGKSPQQKSEVFLKVPVPCLQAGPQLRFADTSAELCTVRQGALRPLLPAALQP